MGNGCRLCAAVATVCACRSLHPSFVMQHVAARLRARRCLSELPLAAALISFSFSAGEVQASSLARVS